MTLGIKPSAHAAVQNNRRTRVTIRAELDVLRAEVESLREGLEKLKNTQTLLARFRSTLRRAFTTKEN